MRKVAFVLSIFLLMFSSNISAQKLRVKQGDSNRIFRSIQEGHALVMFETSLDGLSITPTISEEILYEQRRESNIYMIEADLRFDTIFNIPNERIYYLKVPQSEEYKLNINDMYPKNVYYYTVVLPAQFPRTLSVEYVFSKSAKHGVRMAYGGRYGGYVSYKWGGYYPAGVNIDSYNRDADVVNAKMLGYIRRSYVIGFRMGLIPKGVPLYLCVGGGYGEYGRQWENPLIVGESNYFYSDYIKGFEGELISQCVVFDRLNISLGVDMVVSSGKITVDYQIGLGVKLF